VAQNVTPQNQTPPPTPTPSADAPPAATAAAATPTVTPAPTPGNPTTTPASAPSGPEPPLNNDAVIAMAQAKVAPNVIMSQIRTAKKTNFSMSSAEVIRLSKYVSPEI